jgi:uncharacterized heparinase superfamily protein
MRTVRWLRLEQVLWRMHMHLPRAAPDMAPAPPLRRPAAAWVQPALREPNLIGPTRWRLLAEEHDLSEVGWDDPAVPLLWRYNQHYFDDLNARGSVTRRGWHEALMRRWCEDCVPGHGTAWAPYPSSLRIVNWLKWHLGGVPFEPAWWHSLAVQTRWLAGRVERHLLGNHLFANAKALVYAGLVFDGPEAERWLQRGMRILWRELPEQFLADGAQFERSPMYHALGLEDLLDLLNALQARGSSVETDALARSLRARITAALAWLDCMRHPDGTLARFNDCANGIAPDPDELVRYAGRLGLQGVRAPTVGLTPLQPSGYWRAARAEVVVLMDLAPVGPDYLPGHAHADSLSFEMSVRGRQLIVNRGTSVYGLGPRRQVERGTAAHSTAQVGNHDSSEVWAGFRVGRRARVTAARETEWSVAGSHDGYVHLRGRPVHYRRWTLGEGVLEVEDRVEPAASEPCTVRYHLAPGLHLQGAGRHWCIHDQSGVLVARAEVLDGRTAVEQWQHALRFGELTPALTLSVACDNLARVRWTW